MALPDNVTWLFVRGKLQETITIVEVQDRKSKTKINEFSGWLEKLGDVGPQHLICVSRQDFPISIKERAAKEGGTVRLITLKELDAENIPISMNIVFTHKDFNLKNFNIVGSCSEAEVEELGIRDAVESKLIGRNVWDGNERCWSLDKNELISALNLCRDYFIRPKGESEGEGKLVFDRKEGPALYMYLENQFFRVGVVCDFAWTYQETKIPLSVLSYEQNEAGILAWVAEISYESSQGVTSIKIPFVEIDEGYRINEIPVSMPLGSTLTITVLDR